MLSKKAESWEYLQVSVKIQGLVTVKANLAFFLGLSYRCRLNDCGCAMKNAEEDLALNDLFGLEIGLESQTIWCICKMNESDFDLVENDSFISSNSNSSNDKAEEEAFEVYLLSQPIQCLAISFIIIVAIVCNSLVIHNICMCQVSLWY